MALKKSVGLSLRWLFSVLRCHRQTCPSELFKPLNETATCPGQMCQSDMFGDTSEMDPYDEKDLYDLQDLSFSFSDTHSLVSSYTDACYPGSFSDNGGSSDRRIGKQSEHGRALRQLVEVLQIVNLRIELLEQELSQESNSRISCRQKIKEKVDVVQKYFH